MIRILLLCAAVLAGLTGPAPAQPLTGVARLDVSRSHVVKDWRGRTDVVLHLSQGVPFRVLTLAEPPRLVLEFRQLDWSGVASDALLTEQTGIVGLRFGSFEPGWSRLVADLAAPMLPQDVDMAVDEATGQAVLRLTLTPAGPVSFAAAVARDRAAPRGPPEAGDRFTVIIDPGHGGKDPGAEHGGLTEKRLMLEVAFALREALMRAADVDVVLTRETDTFVSLETRLARAHQAGGDLLVSLHADALPQGGAEGATLYLLSEEASDGASAELAARHDRADILAGADLTGSDDEVTGVLLDLARQETEPRSEALAAALVAGLSEAGGPMNAHPLRRAGFSVLKSADIPSVLVELGFLSSPRDLANLQDPDWRARIVAALAGGILDWRSSDAARRALVRR